MPKTWVRRQRASGLAVAMAYLLTALLFFLLTLSASKDLDAPARQANAAHAGARVTREVALAGGEYALVYLGAYESAASARVGAARHMNRGAAGYVYECEGAAYAVGNVYESADDAAQAARRIREEGLDAGVIALRQGALLARLTATEAQISEFENAYAALISMDAALEALSNQLDAGEIGAESARAHAAVAAYDMDTRLRALIGAMGADSDGACEALRALCEDARARAKSLAGTQDTDMYLSARVKHARIALLMRRLDFLRARA